MTGSRVLTALRYEVAAALALLFLLLGLWQLADIAGLL